MLSLDECIVGGLFVLFEPVEVLDLTPKVRPILAVSLGLMLFT